MWELFRSIRTIPDCADKTAFILTPGKEQAMTTLVINGAVFTQSKRTAERFASNQGLKVVTDRDIFSAAEKYGWRPGSLEKIAYGKKGISNFFTRDWERAVACLRMAVAEQVEKDDGVFSGAIGLLIPQWVTHTTRILVTAEKPYRIEQALTAYDLPEDEALEIIRTDDMKTTMQGENLLGKSLWDRSIYDLVIHADKIGETGVLDMIRAHLGKLRGMSRDVIQKEREDFRLAAEVGLVLSFSGDIDHIWAEHSRIVVSIKKGGLFQKRLKEKIKEIASKVPGVVQVDVRCCHSCDIPDPTLNEKTEKQPPVLLVDDEKKYVEALSERLKIREVDTRVSYSGEDALSYLDRQEAEVMVLDLKMPGIDGFEVLRRTKATKPNVEIIILTGHGSDLDKKTCLDLGAFAFLERPVDIDVLTETMRKAHEKIRLRKTNEDLENTRK